MNLQIELYHSIGVNSKYIALITYQTSNFFNFCKKRSRIINPNENMKVGTWYQPEFSTSYVYLMGYSTKYYYCLFDYDLKIIKEMLTDWSLRSEYLKQPKDEKMEKYITEYFFNKKKLQKERNRITPNYILVDVWTF